MLRNYLQRILGISDIKESLRGLTGAVEDTKAEVGQIHQELKKMGGTNDQLVADVAKLTDAVKANTAALTTLEGIVSQDTTTIASLNTQIAALKAAQPTLDLSGLEADIASLTSNNTAATSAIQAAAPPAA
jgi:chromosome segregation ATPase